MTRFCSTAADTRRIVQKLPWTSVALASEHLLQCAGVLRESMLLSRSELTAQTRATKLNPTLFHLPCQPSHSPNLV